MSPRIPSALTKLFAAILLLSLSPVSAQTGKKLSARELFYAPPAGPAPAAKASAPQIKRAKESKPAEAAANKTVPGKSSAGRVASDNGAPGQTIPASYSTETAVPLGLRYSILKRTDAGSVEVDSDAVFRSGDRIRLRVDVNTAGYLYIINRGSSGNWNPLFPSPKIANGDNRVQKGTQYEIPPGYVFTFDDQPGTERLFIVFSRRPVADLEGLIYSLTDQPKPKTDAAPEDNRILLAQATIQDGMIDRLRTVYARDLIIEKVDETTPQPPAAPAKEKAVYVVNPSRSAESRLVADVTLIHQ